MLQRVKTRVFGRDESMAVMRQALDRIPLSAKMLIDVELARRYCTRSRHAAVKDLVPGPASIRAFQESMRNDWKMSSRVSDAHRNLACIENQDP